jgi:tetratricopeptide (TPR) repeat protein
LLGIVYTHTPNHVKSEQHFKKAILLDSTNKYPYYNLGFLYDKLQRFPEAIAAYQKAIQLDSTYADAYNSLGIRYNENQQYGQAEEMYKKSVELDASQWWAFSNLGLVYHNLQRWEEAATMTQKAIDLMPNDGGLIAELGHAFTHIPERQSEAGPTLLKAQQMDPDWPDTYLYLAVYQIKNGQADQAWENIEIAFKKGLGKDGVINQQDLQIKAEFEPFRKDQRWQSLMAKYFPDQHKK